MDLWFVLQLHTNVISIYVGYHRKYSRVRQWTIGLSGGGDQIAVIRAGGSITRVKSPLSVPSSGIIGEQFIEKIRSVRGEVNLTFKYRWMVYCHDAIFFYLSHYDHWAHTVCLLCSLLVMFKNHTKPLFSHGHSILIH